MKIINNFKELYSLLAEPYVHYAFNHPNGIRTSGSTNYLLDLTGKSDEVRLYGITLENPTDIPNRKGVFNGSTSYASTKILLPERYYIDMEITPISGDTGCILGTALYGDGSISRETDGTIIYQSGNSSSATVNHFMYNGKSYMNNISIGELPFSKAFRVEIMHNNKLNTPVLLKSKSDDSTVKTVQCNAEVKQLRTICMGRGQSLDSRLYYKGSITYIKIYDLDKLTETKMFLQDTDGKYYTIDSTNRIVIIPEDSYNTDAKLLEAISKSGFTTSQLSDLPQALVTGWFKDKFRIVVKAI